MYYTNSGRINNRCEYNRTTINFILSQPELYFCWTGGGWAFSEKEETLPCVSGVISGIKKFKNPYYGMTIKQACLPSYLFCEHGVALVMTPGIAEEGFVAKDHSAEWEGNPYEQFEREELA